MSIVALLYRASKQYAKKSAIYENGREMSYGDLWSKIDNVSTAIYQAGIRENHRVALILPNSSEFICCFFALLKINTIVSPLNPDLTAHELTTIFHNLNPHAIITTFEFINRVMLEFPHLAENKIIILQGNVHNVAQSKKYFNLNELCSHGQNNVTINTFLTAEHTATINYTYRGTGHPLGAMLSHENYVEGVLAYIENTRMSSQHRVLSLLPVSHVYPLVGCMLAPLVSGATIVISKNYLPRSILTTIAELRINHITLVPSLYVLLLQSYKGGEHDLSSLTCCITGGAYMSAEFQKAICSRMGLEIYQGYGLTECLPVTWNQYEHNVTGTLGLPLRPDFQIKIIDNDGKHKGANELGEIVIKSPTVMQGYYNQKDETEMFLKDGWLYTGDYGYMNEHGYLYFAGLKKNVVKVGGNMVDLKEVRDVLLTHPAVLDASAYPKEDALWGHVVEAGVDPRENSGLSENEVRSYCGKLLSRYKVPKAFKIKAGVTQQ